MDMWLWIWVGVVALSMIIEFITFELVSVWFIFGGLISLILAACGVSYVIQIAVFLVVSIALLLGLRKITLKWLTRKTVKTNTDALVGKTYELIDAITKHSNGSIKINGIVWTATTEDESEIKAGTEVIITSISGNKVIVKKSSENKKSNKKGEK